MRTSQPITISLPPKMLAEMEKVRKVEHRTRSELLREALRAYLAMSRIPEGEATPAELRAIAAGRREIARGQYVTFDELAHELGYRPRATSKKSA